MARRLGRALLTAAGLAVAVSVLTTAGSGRSPLAWLGSALQLDFGRGADGAPVGPAIATALPATVLLTGLAALLAVGLGWGGGLLLALHADGPIVEREEGGEPAERTYTVHPGRAVGQALAAVAEACQGVPVFWLGGILVALVAVGLGLLPAGGIASPDLPAFGTPGYLAALQAHPAGVLGDLVGHLLLPALTLALAVAAADLRLIATVLPAQLRAPQATVARAAGLSGRRLLWRAARPSPPVLLASSSSAAPLLAGAVVLIEYLFGLPGAGLLAYHAARAGDTATLGALALLFGFLVIAIGLVADLLAAWADPRLRGGTR